MSDYPCCEHCAEDSKHDVFRDQHLVPCNHPGRCSTRPGVRVPMRATQAATYPRALVWSDRGKWYVDLLHTNNLFDFKRYGPKRDWRASVLFAQAKVRKARRR